MSMLVCRTAMPTSQPTNQSTNRLGPAAASAESSPVIMKSLGLDAKSRGLDTTYENTHKLRAS